MNDFSSHLTINILPAKDHYQIVEFEGDLDKAGFASVKDQLEKLIENFAPQYLIFDFAKLNFINSESIGFLMTVHSRLVKSQKKLILIQSPQNILDIFSVIGLLMIIPHHGSLQEFLAA